jgi:CheY-like chemotaxis protein
VAHLLVVDDDREFASLVGDLLRSEGHTVTVAFGGEEALARVAELRPDSVILDVEMPCMSGPEVA